MFSSINIQSQLSSKLRARSGVYWARQRCFNPRWNALSSLTRKQNALYLRSMTETLQIWHHGLIAQWWAEFNLDGPEIAYFQALVERYGQPVLDVGCGTGRLLLPYLRAALDVDGCDVSADMIELCREKAAREGLSPTLFVQAMHELDPARLYRTIFVCGAFGLGSTRQQ